MRSARGPRCTAIEHGFSVAFFRLEDLLHALKKDAQVPPRSLRRKKYMNVALQGDVALRSTEARQTRPKTPSPSSQATALAPSAPNILVIELAWTGSRPNCRISVEMPIGEAKRASAMTMSSTASFVRHYR